MTVGELVKELRELPQDYPVIIDYKELTNIKVSDSSYVLDNVSKVGYSIGPAVELE